MACVHRAALSVNLIMFCRVGKGGRIVLFQVIRKKNRKHSVFLTHNQITAYQGKAVLKSAPAANLNPYCRVDKEEPVVGVDCYAYLPTNLMCVLQAPVLKMAFPPVGHGSYCRVVAGG